MNPTPEPRTISVVVAPEPTPAEEAKGLFPSREARQAIVEKISLDQLQSELNALSSDISQLVDNAPTGDPDGFRLTELSVGVEITASGGVNLIGTVSVGAGASVVLTFSK